MGVLRRRLARAAAAIAVAIAVLVLGPAPAGSRGGGDPEPHFTFSPASPQAGQTVRFDGTTSTDEDGIARWDWDFENDGVFDSGPAGPAEVDHVYDAPGTYTVRLRVRDTRNNTSETTQPITVQEPPPPPPPPPPPDAPAPTVALVVPTKVTPGTPAGFAAIATGTGLQFAWDLDGDGSFEKGTGPQSFVAHTFPGPADVNVAVRVTDGQGGTAQDAKAVHVGVPPLVAVGFATENVQLGKAATIKAGTLADNESGVSHYLWKFEDAGKTTGAHTLGPYQYPKTTFVTKKPEVKHTFTEAGLSDFSVEVHATDGGVTEVQGFVKIDAKGKKDTIVAIEAVGIPAVGFPTTFKNATPTKTLVQEDTLCIPFEEVFPGQADCVQFPVKTKLNEVKAWKVGNQPKCCEGEEQIEVTPTQPGKLKIALTVGVQPSPGAPEEDQTATVEFDIADEHCGPITVRGVVVTSHDCFKTWKDAQGKDVYEVQPVTGMAVGGLKVFANGAVRIRPATGSIAVAPGAPPIHDIEQDGISLLNPKTVTGFVIPEGGLLPAKVSGGLGTFPADFGGLKAFSATIRVSGATATGEYKVSLPKPFKGQAPVVVTSGAPVARAAGVPDFSLEIPDIAFGPLKVTDATLTKDDLGWHGGGKLTLLDEFAINAADAPTGNPRTGFGLTSDGAFNYAGASYAIPGAGIPLGSSGAFLNEIGFTIQVDPFAIAANPMRITAGGVLSLVGCLALVIPDDGDAGKTAPFCTGEQGEPTSHTVPPGGGIAARLSGVAEIAGIPFPGAAVISYYYPSTFDFAATTAYTLPLPAGIDIGWTGRVSGGFSDVNLWQLGVEATFHQNVICAWNPIGDDICPSLKSGAVLSSKGFAVCATILVVPLSAYVTWDGGFGLQFLTCDALDAVKVFGGGSLLSGSASPVAFAAGSSVRIRAGMHGAILRVTGQGGAPRIRVTGPGGVDVADDEDGLGGAKGAPRVYRSETTGETFVHLPRPRAGAYSVTPQPGSPAIAAITLAEEVAPPRVVARVTRRALRFRVDPAPEQRVTFVEEGRNVHQVLGSTRRTRGTLRFTPAAGPAGTRRIVALVERGGVPRANLVVARYRAAAPRRLAAPVLRVRGTTARWTGVRGATGWRVTAALADGTTVERVLARRTRRFAIPDVRPGTRTRITVRAVDVLGRPGGTATLRFRRPGRADPRVQI